MTYRYHVWLNQGRFEALAHAYTGTIESTSVETALVRLFEIFNTAHPTDYRERSLSVGDVVSVNKEVYACAAWGWQHLSYASPQPTSAESDKVGA